ncbi:MAG: mechanosensitive ion channel [Lachnospiraceae bacterium]|nr:mechanosensitive ion channel [Lachnospiraceae bacterium]
MLENFAEQLPDKLFNLGVRIVLAILVFLMGVQLIKLVRKVIKKALQKSKIDEGAVKFIDSFIKYGAYFLLVILIASWLGVDAASILALLGSASVAIGLAVQGSLSNLVGGVLLLILKPFSMGDYIKDSLGNEGTVCSIDVFYTQLLTPDNKTIVLPNGTLANGCITNYTQCHSRRIDIPVSISYDEDINRVKTILTEVLKKDDGVIKEQDHVVFVDSLAESAVIMNIRCYAQNDVYWEVKWRLTEKIKYVLDDVDIKIPYPQMDIHMKQN